MLKKCILEREVLSGMLWLVSLYCVCQNLPQLFLDEDRVLLKGLQMNDFVKSSINLRCRYMTLYKRLKDFEYKF